MNYKFTLDGRKVLVVEPLNAKETIVQEVVVSADGTEFPTGERFVAKALFDVPVETYKSREERRITESIKRLEGERNKLELEIKDFKFKAQAATAKIKWVNGVTDHEVGEVFDNLRDMMSGEFTHVVLTNPVDIKEWDHKLFSSTDYCDRNRFASLRLISLFGEWNGRLSLSWKVNTYRDGSGSFTTFIPCKSLQEAIEKAKEVIGAKEYLSDEDYKCCIKFGIPVDEAKNAVRLEKKSEYIKKMIADSKERVARLEADLLAVNLD